MPAYSITSAGLIPSMLWALLLLAASLNAQNRSWDRLKCTEPKMSVPSGNRVLMACNISNTFRYITIEWTAYGKTRTIFNKMSPGNYREDAWQLQIQGGWAQLVITDAQDNYSGQYLWVLRGLQKSITSFTLNVTATDNPEPSAVRWEVITVGSIIIVIFTGIIAFARKLAPSSLSSSQEPLLLPGSRLHHHRHLHRNHCFCPVQAVSFPEALQSPDFWAESGSPPCSTYLPML